MSEQDLQITFVPGNRKKFRVRWVVDPEQNKKFMDRLRYEESLPDDGICPWTGEPHTFRVQ